MRMLILLLVCMLHATYSAPQFVTFKDGKIGVNFGGYHAEAGLGGLLTGNAAHGGLSASAGTPWGQNAAAGLGGNIDGRTAGIAYAGAQAMPSVGASAVIGGSAGEQGFIGSEAHANGRVATKSIGVENRINPHYNIYSSNDPVTSAPVPSIPSDAAIESVQRIKPLKKYSLIKSEPTDVNIVHSKRLVKTVNNLNSDIQAPTAQIYVNHNPGAVGNILNIPIGILRTIQESLNGVQLEKSVGVSG